VERELVAVDLETTGYDAASERIVEIGAVRVRLGADGAVTIGERFVTFADPGGPLSPTIARLTGLHDSDLVGAPSPAEAVAAFVAFARRNGEIPWVVGHNVGFDLAFLERHGFPADAPRLDTADLASILLPSAASYALQRLAADAAIVPDAAHRALDDALTSALVLGDLARRVRALPPLIVAELASFAPLLGDATGAFFADAASDVARNAWMQDASGEARGVPLGAAGLSPSEPAVRGSEPSDRPGRRDPRAREAPREASPLRVDDVFAVGGPLAASLAGYEDRAEQRLLAEAIERTMRDGGVLIAEAGTGVGKSLAYLVPALAQPDERVIVSTYTLPLQDQLVRKDLPALQAALGTEARVAVLKGRPNYLCPRRWQVFRGSVSTREEARLLLKTLVWRTATLTGDRAELNLLGGEGELWPRISANDETCDARRCKRTPGGCHLQRARDAAAEAGIVVVNHALLLQDARMRGALLPAAEHVVVDEAHRLEDVATDAFGLELAERRLRRDLERLSHAPAVVSALRDPLRTAQAETLRMAIETALSRCGELFAALAALLVPVDAPPEDRVRITAGVRASDERWLPVELAGERMGDALAGVASASDRLGALGGDEDETADLATAGAELGPARAAIARGIHEPRASDIVWLDTDGDGALALHVAQTHLGGLLRRTLVDPHRSVVFTSATLAVAGSFDFAADRLGVGDVADTLQVGSPFEHRRQALLVIPSDIAFPGEERYAEDVARTIEDVARPLGGRTLALFTSHAAMRDVAGRLGGLDQAGVAVLTQGIDGSRRALLERFMAGQAVLLGTQSFWEGIDLPGDLLRCVVIARLPFAVPDDPLIQGRAERYDDPFRDFHLPQAALRLRQGFGRLIRSKTDYGAVVLLDRRIVTKDYGQVLFASLPDAETRDLPLERIGGAVVDWCASRAARLLT